MGLALPNPRAGGRMPLEPPGSLAAMAIFSLSHSSVGRSTHDAGTAGAHVSYISRSGACREMVGERMPVPEPGERGGAARSWLDEQEAGDRKNGRVIDKVMLALPRELSPEQRVTLVREFAEDVTQCRASWVAGIHDQGKDAPNPHAHLVIRDRDPETGKRVIGMSEKGSTEMLREKWENAANRALERAGHDARIDRRSLAAQGVEDRQPTKHLGPNVVQMERRIERQERDFHGFGGTAPPSEKRVRIERAMAARQKAMEQARAVGRVKQAERIDAAIRAVRDKLDGIIGALSNSVERTVNFRPEVMEAQSAVDKNDTALVVRKNIIKQLQSDATAYAKEHPVRTWMHDTGLHSDRALQKLQTTYETECLSVATAEKKLAESKAELAKRYAVARPEVERKRQEYLRQRPILQQELERLEALQKQISPEVRRAIDRGLKKGPERTHHGPSHGR